MNDQKQERADTARTYIVGQNRLKQADERFQGVLAEAEELWQQKIQSTVELVLRIYDEQENKVVQARSFIRSRLISSDRRKKELSNKMRLAKENHHGTYLGLMSEIE